MRLGFGSRDFSTGIALWISSEIILRISSAFKDCSSFVGTSIGFSTGAWVNFASAIIERTSASVKTLGAGLLSSSMMISPSLPASWFFRSSSERILRTSSALNGFSSFELMGEGTEMITGCFSSFGKSSSRTILRTSSALKGFSPEIAPWISETGTVEEDGLGLAVASGEYVLIYWTRRGPWIPLGFGMKVEAGTVEEDSTAGFEWSVSLSSLGTLASSSWTIITEGLAADTSGLEAAAGFAFGRIFSFPEADISMT